jgi:nitroreductase
VEEAQTGQVQLQQVEQVEQAVQVGQAKIKQEQSPGEQRQGLGLGLGLGFFELLAERYSVRGFSPQPVEPAKLDLILEAARIAPSACNYQPQRIKVATGSDLALIDQCSPCRFGAPVVLIVCYDSQVSAKRSSIDGRELGDLDAAIACTYMMLAAQELGLGSCWVAHFEPEKAKSLFTLKDNIVPIALLPVGYPGSNTKPAAMHYKRQGLEDLLL